MFVNRRDVQIQWGDCDPANIVYYPRYFAMFDDSTSIMFEAAGFSKQDIIHKYGLVGIPMVDTRAKFHIPSTHGDWIRIESRIESFKRSSFEVLHNAVSYTHLTLPIARELAQFGVRVLTIAPGLFLTPLLANLPQEAQDSLAAAIPFPRRLGHADEFAALALHMVENSYLNGEVVRLDGSLRMAPK